MHESKSVQSEWCMHSEITSNHPGPCPIQPRSASARTSDPTSPYTSSSSWDRCSWAPRRRGSSGTKVFESTRARYAPRSIGAIGNIRRGGQARPAGSADRRLSRAARRNRRRWCRSAAAATARSCVVKVRRPWRWGWHPWRMRSTTTSRWCIRRSWSFRRLGRSGTQPV